MLAPVVTAPVRLKPPAPPIRLAAANVTVPLLLPPVPVLLLISAPPLLMPLPVMLRLLLMDWPLRSITVPAAAVTAPLPKAALLPACRVPLLSVVAPL